MTFNPMDSFNNTQCNKQPENPTYVDTRRGNIGNAPSRRAFDEAEYLRNEAAAALTLVGARITEVIQSGGCQTYMHDENQYREIMSKKPKDLNYAVLHKYRDIDVGEVQYRFDNIYYNDRCFLRLVIDYQATESLAVERFEKLYGDLIGQPEEKLLVDAIRDMLKSETRTQTAQIMEALAAAKKKAAQPDAPEKAEQRNDVKKESLNARPGQEDGWNQRFTPVGPYGKPEPIYNNVYVISELTKQFIVHNHPTLGLLIAL